MTTIRQDAWNTDEDLILAEVVLRHIREGSTQLSAFEEVGERLSRTSAACGFRWNSAIRKKYEAAIALAKKQRSKGKKAQGEQEEQSMNEEVSEELTQVNVAVQPPEIALEKKQEPVETNHDATLTMEKVLTFLANYEEDRKAQVAQTAYDELKKENEKLKAELDKAEQEKRIMAEDYRSLLSIMDRARKLSLFETSKEA
ncbi:RsfA family transcriptional regulator [Bacillus suaedae]|uniref:RsfA family transcriptional regulator n=1 Tax=Halalkalibacter suaedae TaxID=2822140 RepID=A0A941AR82_9BACI|nr:RsfA family transcriptional regulator [Bacillus suaedae]MBP3952138.1 RsfA family transcriptional regulator [Bacillus suaedae]